MRVDVRLYATLKRYAKQDNNGLVILNISEGSKAGDVVDRIGIDVDEIHILMVNGVHSDLDRILNDGDRIGFFPAVGGG